MGSYFWDEGEERNRDRLTRPGGDFLNDVWEVCRLHLDKIPVTKGADIEPHHQRAPGIDHLVIRYSEGPFPPERLIVGAHDGAATEDLVERLLATSCCEVSPSVKPQLVCRGTVSRDIVERAARENRVWLRSFEDYQRVWDYESYLNAQSNLLRTFDYPLNLHVDKRWSVLGATEPEGDKVTAEILHLLNADRARFVLVLGDAGTGKTFLMRTLAATLARDGGLVPVLLTMRGLERAHSLRDLLHLHMSKLGEDGFHEQSFRYLLNKGKIVLLVDGFDELGLRVSYERVPEHFAMLREAAQGNAKVVLTSRFEYFATDTHVRAALGDEIGRMPGSRILRLFELDEGQRRELVVKMLGDEPAEADTFLNLLGDVPDLLELGSNPRMLMFMIDWRAQGILKDEELRNAARGDEMTGGKLYELLITRWLEHEVSRQRYPGGLRTMSPQQRLDAVTEAALAMWHSGTNTASEHELKDFAAAIRDLSSLEMRFGEAVQTIGSGTLLVRSGDREFRFIHQSVMEWLIAKYVMDRMRRSKGFDGLSDALAGHELTPSMVSFLWDMADRDRLIEWARRTARAAKVKGVASKPNAALLLQKSGTGVDAINYAAQDLRWHDFSKRDLSGAVLRNADLSAATLCNLREADLRDARLVGSKLNGADLRGADLSGADLSYARLLGADLRGASLNDATLHRAALVAAKLDANSLTAARNTFGMALSELGVTPQVGSRSPISATLVSSKGDLLWTGHIDGTVRLWDSDTGQLLRVLAGHTAAVWALASSPDGGWLASASGDRTVRLWDPATGEVLRILAGHIGGVRALAVAPDGGWLASGGGDKTVRLWDPATGEVLRTLEGHTAWVRALAAAPDGTWLASGGEDSMVRLWDPVTGQVLRILEGLTAWVLALAVAPDGTWLASGSSDSTVRLWDPATGQALRTLEGHTAWVRALAAAPDGTWLASGSGDRTLRLWDPATGQALRTLGGHTGGVRALAVAFDGSWLASGSEDRTVRLWNPETGQVLRILEGHTAWVRALAAAPDGTWLASGGEDTTVRLWDPVTGQVLRILEGHTAWVLALAVAPDGTWLASGSSDSTVRLWDPTRGKGLRTLEGHTGGVRALAPAPHGMWLASGSSDSTVRLWDPATGQLLRILEDHTGAVRALAAAPDGTWLASGSEDTTVRLWNPVTGQVVGIFEDHIAGVRALAAAPDGAWLMAGCGDGRIHLWDMHCFARLATLLHLSEGWAVLFPDGSYKLCGEPIGLWWASGLCRFEPGELDPYVEEIQRLRDDESILHD